VPAPRVAENAATPLATAAVPSVEDPSLNVTVPVAVDGVIVTVISVAVPKLAFEGFAVIDAVELACDTVTANAALVEVALFVSPE
jgi:hypothetical protein